MWHHDCLSVPVAMPQGYPHSGAAEPFTFQKVHPHDDWLGNAPCMQDFANSLARIPRFGLHDYSQHLPRQAFKDGQTATASETTWTLSNSTFCRGPAYLNYTKTDTMRECQSACEDAAGCWMYSWCDTQVEDG